MKVPQRTKNELNAFSLVVTEVTSPIATCENVFTMKYIMLTYTEKQLMSVKTDGSDLMPVACGTGILRSILSRASCSKAALAIKRHVK